MAGDSGTGEPREVHVSALPDCLMTSWTPGGGAGSSRPSLMASLERAAP